MAVRVEDTCVLAESVSGRVRELNTAKVRITEALDKVTEILNLKYCVEGITAAMDGRDYEQAAAYVLQYSKFDEDVLEQTSTDALVAATSRLRTEVGENFDAAVEALDRAAVLRFARLYVPIGLGDQGVQAYGAYLCAALEHEFAAVHQGLEATLAGKPVEGEEPVTFVSALTSLYDVAVFAIESEEDLIKNDLFGGDENGDGRIDHAFWTILGIVQGKIDQLAGKVLDRFMAVRSLESLATRISQAILGGGGASSSSSSSTRPTGGGDKGAKLPSTKQVDLLLYEIASISHHTERFDAFLRAASGGEGRGLVHVSGLNKRVQEMIASYLSLEMYFMNESVSRAISLDETSDESATSSMVDDVFYVLSKCARRAVSTFSTNSVCAMVNNISFVLSESLVPLLQSQIAEHGATFFESRACAVVLNNLDLAGSYVPQLRSSIEADVSELGFSPEDEAKITMCLSDLADTVPLFTGVLRDALDNICSSLQPKLKPLTSVLLDISYELTEADFAANERVDPFISSLITGISGVIAPYKSSLSPANYDAFVAGVIKYVASRIEIDSRHKVYTPYGALQFDKDVRALMTFFSSLTQRPVRDMLARLTQIATLLNVESLQEVSEYWNSMDWRLKPVEVKRVLRLRRDFSQDAIARLDLD